MAMKQSLVHLSNVIPHYTLNSQLFSHCSFGGFDVKKQIRYSLCKYQPSWKQIHIPPKREEKEQIIDSKVPEMGWDTFLRFSEGMRVCLPPKGWF